MTQCKRFKKTSLLKRESVKVVDVDKMVKINV